MALLGGMLNMKRVCFVTELLFAETRNLKHIRELLEQLMAEGPVECWFYKCCRPFAVQALETIMEIRKERPDAELAVVDVVDPLETETENMDWSEQEECDFFPRRYSGPLYHRPCICR